jgi:tetratricopeptide (TPR) repeat protein
MIKALNKFGDGRLLAGLLLFFALAAFLGLSPRPHAIRQEMEAARRALEFGSPRDAATHLARAAERLPSRTDLWESAGRYALQGQDPEAAIRYFRRAGQKNLSFEGQMALAEAYWQSGSPGAALQVWQAAGRQDSLPVDIQQRVVAAHLAMKDYPAAAAELRSLTTRLPNDAHLRYHLGLITASQDPEAALAHLVQAAEIDPSLAPDVETFRRRISAARRSDDQAYLLVASGRALASLNEWELASEAFRQATLLRPDFAEAWAFLGEARQQVANTDPEASQDGFSDLQKALELDPDSIAANLLMALYWQRQEGYSQALKLLQKAIQLDPKNPALQVEIGRTHALLGDLESAVQAYQKAVQFAPQDSAYWRYLAEFSLKNDYQMREIGLPAARRAVILSRQEVENLDMMAQVLIRLNDLLNAERFLHRALAIRPDDPLAHLHLGVVHALKGETGRAYQEFTLARSLGSAGPAGEQAERLLQIYFP